jgi:hypothetical protein
MSKLVSAFVRAVPAAPGLPNPATQIAVAVDTAYIAANAGQNITTGLYMTDNQLNLGSSGEGSLELHTSCNNGSLIGFSVYPINQNSGDTVAITGFTVSQGSVFGGAGYPIQQSQTGNYWIGQAMNSGSQTYQIQIKVTTGGLRPVSYYVNWDPFITSQ